MSQELADSVDALTAQTTALLQEYVEGNTTLQNKAIEATDAAASALASKESATADAATATAKAAEAEQSANNAAAIVTGGTATLTPEAGKIPLADANGKIDSSWLNFTDIAVYTPTMDVPFQDSLTVVMGNAPHDQIDVSAAQDGSAMVTLPSRSISYGRSSGRTVVRSGVVVDVESDEPAFSKDGLELYGVFTNLMPMSEPDEDTVPFGADSAWDKSNITTNSGIKFIGATASPVYTDFVLSANSDLGYSVFVYRNGSSGRQTVRCESRGQSSTRVMAVSVDWSDNSVSITTGNAGWRMSYEWINRDVCRIHLLFDAGVESLQNTTARVVVYTDSNGAAAYYGGFQLVGHDRIFPYVRTSGAAAATSGDIINIEVDGNLPAPGQPFSLVMDVNVGMGSTAFWLGVPGSLGIYLERYSANGKLRVVANQGHAVLASDDNFKLDEVVRCIYSYGGDNAEATLFVDGDLISSSSSNVMPNYMEEGIDWRFQIGGRNNSNIINGVLKNFKIYPFAIDLKLAKYMGGAK